MTDKHETEQSGVPAAGSLTGDLAIDTDDVATLKQRLGRARERLAFYESFDRIIQENIRRSSELMIEATELHEKADRAAEEQARAQTAMRDQRAADQAHYAALLEELQVELDRTRASLNTIAARVTTALDTLGQETLAAPTVAPGDHRAAPEQQTVRTSTEAGDLAGGAVAAYGTPTEDDGSAPAAASSPVTLVEPAAPGLGPAPTPEAANATAGSPEAAPAMPAEPQLVEMLVHGVPTARVAISLQNHLRGLDQVKAVDAREFVEGLLRLQVTTTAPLAAADLDGWSDGAGSETVRDLPDLLEISLPGTTER